MQSDAGEKAVKPGDPTPEWPKPHSGGKENAFGVPDGAGAGLVVSLRYPNPAKSTNYWGGGMLLFLILKVDFAEFLGL